MLLFFLWRKGRKSVDEAYKGYEDANNSWIDYQNQKAQNGLNAWNSTSDPNKPLDGLVVEAVELACGNFGGVVGSKEKGFEAYPAVVLKNNTGRTLTITGVSADIAYDGEELVFPNKGMNGGRFQLNEGQSAVVAIKGTGGHRLPLLSEDRYISLQSYIASEAGKNYFTSVGSCYIAKSYRTKAIVKIGYSGENVVSIASARYELPVDIRYEGLNFHPNI